MMTEDKLRFIFDWEPALEVRAPELQATWSRLEIWVGDECVTQVEDIDSRSVRHSIYVPLYPLAEWIAYNWWFLKAHSRPASLGRDLWSFDSPQRPRAGLGWVLEHHNFRAAGDGFLWPNLTIVPEGRYARLVWSPDDSAAPERPVKYIRRGEAWVESALLELSLARFVDDVSTRLTEQGITETSLQKEWSELRRTDAEEAAFCIASARLGLDPYSDAVEIQDSIERAAVALPESLVDDFFDAVSPQKMTSGIEWVTNATHRIRDYTPDRTSGAGLRAVVGQPAEVSHARPWDIGWTQARNVRDRLGLDDQERFEVGELLSVVPSDSHDLGLQAIGGASRRNASVLVLGRPMISQTQRFAEARALWHFLFDQRPVTFLITPAHTDRQRVERAFAAELLAPAAGILHRLDLGEIGFALDDIEAIAEHFEVSSMVIRHQIENQILAGS